MNLSNGLHITSLVCGPPQQKKPPTMCVKNLDICNTKYCAGAYANHSPDKQNQLILNHIGKCL